MPIPFTEQEHVEIILRGDIAAAGSSARPTWSTFHFRRFSQLFAINKADVQTAFQASIGVALIAALNERWSQAYNTVRCINDVNDPILQVTNVNAGAITGDSMSTLLAAYSLFRTNLRKASFRGSKRWGPLSESDTTSGSSDILNAAALTRFGTLNAAILAGFTDASGDVWIPVILSRKLSQLKVNPTTVVATDVGSALINKRIGRMKVREVVSVY